jgi:hypothetical protein
MPEEPIFRRSSALEPFRPRATADAVVAEDERALEPLASL